MPLIINRIYLLEFVEEFKTITQFSGNNQYSEKDSS
jgi:hypothetical protein